MEMGKMGEGNDANNNNLNRNKVATILTVINGTPAMWQNMISML